MRRCVCRIRSDWKGAAYGTSTTSTFVSSAIDLDKVIYKPTFNRDLTSFQFK